MTVQVDCAEAVSELLALPFHKERGEGWVHVPRTRAHDVRCGHAALGRPLTPLPTGLVPDEQADGGPPVPPAALKKAVRAGWGD